MPKKPQKGVGAKKKTPQKIRGNPKKKNQASTPQKKTSVKSIPRKKEEGKKRTLKKVPHFLLGKLSKQIEQPDPPKASTGYLIYLRLIHFFPFFFFL